MAEKEKFVPYSSPMPIPGSSYSAQVGKVDERWALRLVKGKEVLDMGLFEDLNGNKMIAYIISTVAIPMINPYQISQSVKALIKQAEHGPLQMATTAAETGFPAASGSEYAGMQAGTPAAAPSTMAAPGDACPRCRRTIQPNFFYCPYCSQKLRDLKCQGCQREIRLDYSLCPYCGLKL